MAPIRHVLIIGAGLGGPALALSLARHQIRSTLYELRPRLSESGGSISLGPNALQVLDRYCGVYDALKAEGYSYSKFGAFTEDGEKLGDIQIGDPEDKEGGYPALRVMRTRLNRVLVDKCKETGLVHVEFGKKVQRIEEDEKSVTAHFEDGSSATGDIIVGADGIHSKVRDHVLGDKAVTPAYDGIVVVNGFLPRSKAVTPPDFTFPSFLFTPSGLFMTIPINADGSQLAWGINKTLPDRSRAEWRELESSGEAARLAKKDFESITMQPVRSLLDEAKDEESKLWATYSIPNISTWHTHRTVLMGDAAHGMPPNGQGAAMAFEDAAVLSRVLTELQGEKEGVNGFAEMFDRYEKARRPRIDKIRGEGKAARNMRTESGPWVWMAKKWAFRAFFWWKNGVIYHTSDTDYDVDKVDIKG